MLVGQFGEINPPYLDGVGQVMLAYCRYLPMDGYESVYIAPSNKKYGDNPGCEALFYHSAPLGKLAYRFGFPMIHPSFRKKLLDMPFDLVHAHAPFLAGRAARSVARKKGIPLVATFHSKYYDDVFKATHSKALARAAVWYTLRFFNTCDEVWTVNEATAQVLRDYGFKKDIIVMPNGTDIINPEDVPEIMPPGLALPEDGTPVLLFVGQLDFKKNPHLVLKALKILKDQDFRFRFVIVGEGPDHKHLMDLTEELGLKGEVTFTGRLSDRSELMTLYRRADLFTFPSVYDNAALVIREAAMMGTPALVAAGSCSAEGITHMENGFICPADPESIARCIKEALPHCKEAGQMAQKTIPISWRTLMKDVEKRYEALCAAKR